MVGAGERFTLRVSDDVAERDVSTQVQSDRPVIAERSMYWGGRRGGHCSIGATESSRKWYFSEGSAAWGFETYLLVQNPGNESATFEITYMTPAGPVQKAPETLAPNSRKTLFVNSDLPGTDTSIYLESDTPVIAERAMYWNNGTGKAGHCSIGATAPENEILMAEGSTAWGFETFLCLQNPNRYQVDAKVQYIDTAGVIIEKSYSLPASGRLTIAVNNEIPGMDFATKVTSIHRIMAERAMYWNSRGGGHGSIGHME
ncbi:MAG: hypothetical protein JW738_00175 [Actinobacteria bacterium]|nr:hypothetical protein [Actinomycetota bacterium]